MHRFSSKVRLGGEKKIKLKTMMLLPLLTLFLSTLVFSAMSFIPVSASMQTQQYSEPPGMPGNALQYNRTDITPYQLMEQLMGNNTYVFAYRNVTMMMNCSQNSEMEITIDSQIQSRYLALNMEQDQPALLTMNISATPPTSVQTMQRTLNFYCGIEPNATLQLQAQLRVHINTTALNAELNRVVNTSRLCWMYWNRTGQNWIPVESWIDGDGYLVCNTNHFSTWTVAEIVPLQVTGSLSETEVSVGDSVTISSTIKDEDGNLIEGATVKALVGSVTVSLSDTGSGIYEGTVDTSNLGEGTLSITVSAEKIGYDLGTSSLTLIVQPAIQWTLYAIIGILGVAAIAGVVIWTKRR